MDLTIVSCANLPEPDPDAAPLASALESAGLKAEVLAWDDPEADWSRARMTLLRSTWNYPENRDAFLDWARKADTGSRLWNPYPAIRWNTYKGYLLELEAREVPITPTVLLQRGSEVTLQSIMNERGWPEVVVKPAISAASFKTRRYGRKQLGEGEEHLRELVAERDVLIQQYLSSVEDHGERSLVWIDGALTHAVRKSPRFEGQDESVSTSAVEIGPDEATLAGRVLDAVEGPLLYARIDMAPGPGGAPVLMELELVEPSLFFRQSPPSLDRFVEGIRQRLEAE